MKKFRQVINDKKKAGAGEIGTDELVLTYVKDTPGQELDEASVDKLVKFFLDYHRKNKNKKIDRNMWSVARMAGIKYRELEDALVKQSVRNLLPRDVEQELSPLMRNRQRRQTTLQKYANVY